MPPGRTEQVSGRISTYFRNGPLHNRDQAACWIDLQPVGLLAIPRSGTTVTRIGVYTMGLNPTASLGGQAASVKGWCVVEVVISVLVLMVVGMLALRFGTDSRDGGRNWWW